ncbi:MAG: PepSY-associated TM helix domain-containing protein [Bryobacteraceae bacterium]
MALAKVVVRIRFKPISLRRVILGIHLCLGLTAGIFLAILGLTGSIMAFEGDIDHWFHPELWYVTPNPHPLPENDLVSIAQNRFRPARVFAVQFPRAPNLAQVMRMTDGTIVYLNPYNGSVLGDTVGISDIDQLLIYIHQLHLRLVPDPQSAPQLAQVGKIVVSVAALLLCLQVPIGLILWGRRKRGSIASPWLYFRDAHQLIGIYASLFLWIAAITGILIGFDFGEKFFYDITKSSPPVPLQPFQSVEISGAIPILADQVLEVTRRTMPGASAAMMFMPQRPGGSFTVLMRVPEETSQNVHSSVTVDQYSGKVLNVRNYLTDSLGYRLIRLNRSIHNGDIFGLPSHILVSLSSLMLVAMVVSGFVIWWKKLAR